MFDLGGGELVIILVLASILIGPKELPRVARQLGRWYRQIKFAVQDIKDTIEREIDDEESPKTEPDESKPQT